MWAEQFMIFVSLHPILVKNIILVDQLSHLDWVLPTEWLLLPQVFDAICKKYRHPLIDLFAIRSNTKLPCMCPVSDPMV